MLTSDFVSFVSCLDACLDAVGVRPSLQAVTTNNYNNIADFHTTIHSKLSLLSLLSLVVI
jgi:hypothetical protein